MTGSFAFPTTILFGAGRIAELRDRLTGLGASRPLIVTDSGLVETDTFKSVRAVVEPANARDYRHDCHDRHDWESGRLNS